MTNDKNKNYDLEMLHVLGMILNHNWSKALGLEFGVCGENYVPEWSYLLGFHLWIKCNC